MVQTLANLTGLYPKDDPATVIMKCDKTLCGTGAIQAQFLNFSLRATLRWPGPRRARPRTRSAADQVACVDYVQSKRDGSGDTHLYLLLTGTPGSASG